MTKHKLSPLVLAVLGALTLGACNNSSDSDSGSTTGTSLSKKTGVITGFGSVFVNGVEYETAGSSFTLDEAPGSEDNLKIGMVVTIEGTVNADGKTGVAAKIDYADELEGIVSAVNLSNGVGTLTVMGQTVTIDAATRFESKVGAIATLNDVAAGNIVEVSGYSAGDGAIHATLVEVKKTAFVAGSDEIELKGLIKNHDAATHTFYIGAQKIDYSNAQVEGFANGAPVDGKYVEVKSTTGMMNGVLMASKVEIEGDGDKGVDGDEGDEFELEGMVASVVSATEFMLDGQAVLIDNGTEFEHGVAGDIKTGVKLEVKGALNADGKIVAEKIEFRAEGDLEIKGTVEAVDASAGTVTVGGKTIKVNTQTVMADDRDDNGAVPVRYFSLADLAVGDLVEVHYYLDDSNALVATKLERDDPESH
jgi:hypothetical protein